MKYEYRFLKMNSDSWKELVQEERDSCSHETEINKWGAAGWEIIRIKDNGNYTVYTFKREIS